MSVPGSPPRGAPGSDQCHMISRILKYIAAAVSFLPTAVFAAVETGLEETAQTAFGEGVTARGNISLIIGGIVAQLLALIGVIFFLLTIYAGFLWMTAQGDEKKVGDAKNILKAAVIGMVIISISYVVTSFVLKAIATPTGVGL